MVCLESCAEVRGDGPKPDTDVTILDGAVLVNFLKPDAAKTFDDYALKVFLHTYKDTCKEPVVWI